MALTAGRQSSTFSRIPNEILLCIAEELEFPWDLNSFTQVNHSFHATLNRYLYQRNIKEWHSSALGWAAEHGIESTARRMLDEGASPSCDQNCESSPDHDPLAMAARNGNDSLVQLLLERGANPNADYGYSDTYGIARNPLFYAICNGSESTVRILLDHGAESDFLLHPNYLASSFAREGNLDKIKILAEMQCDLEVGDSFDGTPLSNAVFEGHVDVVQYLLEVARVDPNRRGPEIWPEEAAFFEAAQQNNPIIMECFLRNGADINYRMCGDSALSLAMEDRNMEVVQVLLKYMDKEKLCNSEQYIEVCAAEAACGSESNVRDLIDRGRHLDENKFNNGFSFLMQCSSMALAWAAEMGHEKVVLQLLTYGVNYKTYMKSFRIRRTPLMAAIENGHLHIIKLLLGEDFDPYIFDEGIYDEPLLTAVRRGYVDMVEFLLEYGADPNARSSEEYGNALLNAVEKGQEKICTLLLDKDADPNGHGRTSNPILYAALDNEVIFGELLARGANPNANGGDEDKPILIEAIKRGRTAQVEMLLDYGAEQLELKTFDEEVLLSNGASGGSAMLELLFQHGLEEPHLESREAMAMITAAIERQSPSGLKVLLGRGYKILQGDHFSHINDSWQYVDPPNFNVSETIIDILLSHGININATGRHRRTCLWEVIEHKNTFMLSVLLKRGANPLHRDRDGETPLLHAIWNGNDDDEIMLLIKSIRKPHAGISHDEFKREISRAESEAAARKKWKLVRALQRCYYWDFGCGM